MDRQPDSTQESRTASAVAPTATCASHGHLYGVERKCIFCGALREPESLDVRPMSDYLKDGETPEECIARNRRDVDIALGVAAKAMSRREELLALAREFVAYWTTQRAYGDSEVGCGMCGGIPHSTTCYVGRFDALVKADAATVFAGVDLGSGKSWSATAEGLTTVNGENEYDDNAIAKAEGK